MTPEQKAAYEAYQKRIASKELMASETPTQKTRAIAQGFTFGFADEAEAKLRSLYDPREYEEILNEIRGSLDQYSEAYPKSSLGYELSGAALPALLATIWSGGGAAPVIFGRLAAKLPKAVTNIIGTTAPKTLIGAGLTGATQGAVTGIGKGETASERAEGAVVGGFAGSVLGPAAKVATDVIGGSAIKIIDAYRRKVGDRGASVVEAELQRLVAETGGTVDEIIAGIQNGTIMAENKTLLDAVRGYRAQGGASGATLKQVMERRPIETRKGAMANLQGGLSQVDDPNVLRQMTADFDEAKRLEKEAYDPFKIPKVSNLLQLELKEAIARVPQAGQALNKLFGARGGDAPFVISDAGKVTFKRTPTVEEAEIVRRVLSEVTSSEYRGGMGSVGEAIGEVESGLRRTLDVEQPNLAIAREGAKTLRVAQDAYKNGTSIFGKSADQVDVDFAEILKKGEGAVKAYRAGLMTAIRNKITTGSKQSVMKNLLDPERKEGIILRTVFPEDQLDEVLNKIDVAATSQAASNRILQGADTAITTQQIKNQGQKIGGGELMEVIASPNPINIGRVVNKFIDRTAPQLTDVERQRVINVLVSEDAAFVKNMLKDESGIAKLQEAVKRLINTVKSGATQSVTKTSPELASPILGE
tara:strand:- start:40 stop:1974 length:1935 start_codon:yes stop_codon:yes gene_type:complete